MMAGRYRNALCGIYRNARYGIVKYHTEYLRRGFFGVKSSSSVSPYLSESATTTGRGKGHENEGGAAHDRERQRLKQTETAIHRYGPRHTVTQSSQVCVWMAAGSNPSPRDVTRAKAAPLWCGRTVWSFNK